MLPTKWCYDTSVLCQPVPSKVFINNTTIVNVTTLLIGAQRQTQKVSEFPMKVSLSINNIIHKIP